MELDLIIRRIWALLRDSETSFILFSSYLTMKASVLLVSFFYCPLKAESIIPQSSMKVSGGRAVVMFFYEIDVVDWRSMEANHHLLVAIVATHDIVVRFQCCSSCHICSVELSLAVFALKSWIIMESIPSFVLPTRPRESFLQDMLTQYAVRPEKGSLAFRTLCRCCNYRLEAGRDQNCGGGLARGERRGGIYLYTSSPFDAEQSQIKGKGSKDFQKKFQTVETTCSSMT
jgi:hypothetical protein